MLRPSNNRIPVTAGPRLIEMADPSRVQALIRCLNVRVIRQRKRTIVELQLLNWADDSRVPPKTGNPQSYTTRSEDSENPRNLLHFKRRREALC